MPSIFNNDTNKKFKNIATAAQISGSDIVGKTIAKGIIIGNKTFIGIIIGIIVVIGFIIGSFNISKHLYNPKE